MPCAQSREYNEAIQNLRCCVSDEELRHGQPALNALGVPMPFSGNFADVYKVDCPASGNTWAVKCFTREVPGLRERYRKVSTHLEEARLPFMVDFRYVEPGIRVGQEWHPFLKMRWVEGLALNEFVGKYLDRPATLRQLLGLWEKLAARLREAETAHADLQHGNVLLVPRPKGQFALRLIDYDGMYVPSLSGTRSGELGHPAYQHPQRLREGIYSQEVDRFSHLAIYCAVRCLMVGKRNLWRLHTGENLLFREPDFANPEGSEVFRELWALPDAEARSLVGRLFLALQGPLAETPLLGDILSNGSVVSLSGEEERQVESALGGGVVVAQPSVVSSPEEAVSEPKGPWWETEPSPLPEASAAGVMGTVPDVTSGTQPALVTTPRRYGPRALTLGATLVRGALHAPVAVFWMVDGVLRALAGEENVILHNFLRMLALVALALLVFVGLRMGPQWIENALALISESEAPQRGFSRPTPRVKARSDEADAKELQQRWADQLGTPVEETNSIGMKLVLIPPGEFLMGSGDSDEDADEHEKPQHSVRITEPFYLAVTEVTEGQWEVVTGDNSSGFEDDPKRPMEGVSWNDAMDFCGRLSQRESKQYRLPTEAEWEYACRALSSTRWCFGDEEASLRQYAWYDESLGSTTHPVAQKRPNGWGLYDMHGNVWEWCADWYDSDYYRVSPSGDPKGPDSGSYRVLRGGALHEDARSTRSPSRDWVLPDERYEYGGFRVARTCGDGPSTPPVPEATEPLRITPVPPQTVDAGRPLTVPVSVDNAEYWEAKVRYTLAPEPPNGAEIDERTGLFSWTPTQEEGPGTHEVTVLATAPDGQAHEHTFLVTVTSANEITVDLGAGVTMEMVRISAGAFLMGSPDSDDNADDDEKPQHRVRITQPFYLGKYEVTQEQWEAVMGDNPSRFKGPENPVEMMSWDDCQAFLRKLNEQQSARGRTFRLPTEAEWEYACRAGSSTRWCFGDDEGSLGDYAWYDGNSGSSTRPVGEKSPNAWGLYDVHGNVWEWCSDWYGSGYYGESPGNDPMGPSSGSFRLIRGGGWFRDARKCCSAYRGNFRPGEGSGDLGFRVSLEALE